MKQLPPNTVYFESTLPPDVFEELKVVIADFMFEHRPEPANGAKPIVDSAIAKAMRGARS